MRHFGKLLQNIILQRNLLEAGYGWFKNVLNNWLSEQIFLSKNLLRNERIAKD
jgi:hypothetical protein